MLVACNLNAKMFLKACSMFFPQATHMMRN